MYSPEGIVFLISLGDRVSFCPSLAWYYGTQAILKLMAILLPQPPELWDGSQHTPFTVCLSGTFLLYTNYQTLGILSQQQEHTVTATSHVADFSFCGRSGRHLQPQASGLRKASLAPLHLSTADSGLRCPGGPSWSGCCRFPSGQQLELASDPQPLVPRLRGS